MTMEGIVESGMTFGPYPDGHCFHIERSATYNQIQQDVQVAEFLLLRLHQDRPAAVWIIEAKSSSPRQGTQPQFDQFIAEIREKLANTLAIGLAARLGRHAAASAELPDAFKTLDLATTDFRLILVINGHQKAWLAPLQDALSKALRSTVKAWALPPSAVLVINDGLARKHGLIA